MTFGTRRIEGIAVPLTTMLVGVALFVWFLIKMKVYGDIGWGETEGEVELEKAYVCDMQCTSAGYEVGTEEYFACIERCYVGN